MSAKHGQGKSLNDSPVEGDGSQSSPIFQLQETGKPDSLCKAPFLSWLIYQQRFKIALFPRNLPSHHLA